MQRILDRAQYVKLAMSLDNEPYLVTVNHFYDRTRNCIYFHCAQEGKKVDILRVNPIVWGQALLDYGYAQGECTHLYATTHFRGHARPVDDLREKEYALRQMAYKLDLDPERVIAEQVTETAVQRVNIIRIDVAYMSGKKSKEVTI